MDIEDKIAQSTVNDSNLSLLLNREMENISLFQKMRKCDIPGKPFVIAHFIANLAR